MQLQQKAPHVETPPTAAGDLICVEPPDLTHSGGPSTTADDLTHVELPPTAVDDLTHVEIPPKAANDITCVESTPTVVETP